MSDSSPHSRPDVALILEALEYQEEHSLEGPLFPEAQEELRRLVEQLETAREERDLFYDRLQSTREQLKAARGLLVRARPLCIEAYEKRRGAAVQPLKDDITKWLDSNPAIIPSSAPEETADSDIARSGPEGDDRLAGAESSPAKEPDA